MVYYHDNPFDLRLVGVEFFAEIVFQCNKACPEILSLLNKKNLVSTYHAKGRRIK